MKVAAFNYQGIVGILVPGTDIGLTFEEIVSKDLPPGATDVITLEDSELPQVAIFRNCWKLSDGTVTEDLDLCKELTHKFRRAARDKEFEPWDRKATVPALVAEAEAERELIRAKYAQIQIDIDACVNTTELKTVLSTFA